jgi:hypothetical protein
MSALLSRSSRCILCLRTHTHFLSLSHTHNAAYTHTHAMMAYCECVGHAVLCVCVYTHT